MESGGKKKSEFQLQWLERFYSEMKYPQRKVMEAYGSKLGLTYNQVRVWFSERRRKEKGSRNRIRMADLTKKSSGQTRSLKKITIGGDCECSEFSQEDGINSERDSHDVSNGEEGQKWDSGISSSSIGVRKCLSYKKRGLKFSTANIQASKKQMRSSSRSRDLLDWNPLTRVQVLLSHNYILGRVFRKDGPPLGVEFDSIPARGFNHHTSKLAGYTKHLPLCNAVTMVSKRRKVPNISNMNGHNQNKKKISAGRHGIGKGLMTVWHATNQHGVFPVGLSSADRAIAWKLNSHNSHRKITSRTSNVRRQQNAFKKASCNKIQEKRKLQKRAKTLSTKNKNHLKQQLWSLECRLFMVDLSRGQSDFSMDLVDDEELELAELQAGPNSFRCSAHLSSNGESGCPLCKDMLGRFPPKSINMKPPICMRPWVSSPDLVKKLFKVFRFLYKHAVKIHVCSFTLDELAQAFLDKNSMLLGKIHVALLTYLLCKVHSAVSSGFPRASRDCRLLGFMHSVKHQGFDVVFWIQSLNALTWIEVLRQVSIAAGFGSVGGSSKREILNKEGSLMVKYGLHRHTLKGELFFLLSKRGSQGSKVSDLARSSRISSLSLPSSTGELEYLISSTLSSDISLFEKIGTSVYRLRSSILYKMKGCSGCDRDDSGSIDDENLSSSSDSGSDDDEFDPLEVDYSLCLQSIAPLEISTQKKCKSKGECTEIDESFSGEAWFLGLMEGEYFDLSIEEKLDALVALVDLTNSASCLEINDPIVVSPAAANNSYCRSGAKIKKLTSQHMPVDSISMGLRNFQPCNSLENNLENNREGQKCGAESEWHGHPLQAINLGFDRRYNSYWLFLGPCEPTDPGHRRVYFESSEDGHWEVIDTQQDLSSLLSALDCRGAREASLFESLEKRENFLSKAMMKYMEAETDIGQCGSIESPDSDAISGNGSSVISSVDNNAVSGDSSNDCTVCGDDLLAASELNCAFKKQEQDRREAFDKWVWTSFFGSLNVVKNQKRSYHDSFARCERCHDLFWRDEKHCRICHTTFELDFDLEEKYAIHVATCSDPNGTSSSSTYRILPSQLQALKAAIHAIEAAMPEGALVGWSKSSHNLWGKRLRRTSCLSEFFQVVKDFVGAIKEDWSYECSSNLGVNALGSVVIIFKTLPLTVAAVALWMVKLDFLIAPYLERSKSNYAVDSMPPSKGMRTRSCETNCF